MRRALLLVWLGGVWLSYATSSSDRVYPHYLITVYPISFAVAALGLSDLVALAGARSRAAAAAAIAVLAFVLVGDVAFTLAFQRFLASHGGADGDYVTVYEDSHAAATRCAPAASWSPTTRCSTSSSPDGWTRPSGRASSSP